MICKACENLTIDELFERASNPPGHLILHPSFDHLTVAASNGCDTCRAFHARFNNEFLDLKEKVVEFEKARGASPPVIVLLQMGFGQHGKRPINKIHVQIGDDPDRPGIEQLKISFRVSKTWEFEPKEETTGYDLWRTKIDHDLGSDQNFGIAQGWIQDCCNDHDPSICPPLEDADLPTRLIDVGTPQNQNLRLTETSKGEKGQYLALSHCWGPPETKKLLTKTETLSSRLASIDVQDMPPNFSDAVVITRRLGYKYLWIDSLCIIQDSKSDWETESQNMGNIYTNAAITLAAAAATSSEGGLLTKGYQPLSNETMSPKKWFLTDSIGRSHIAFMSDEKNKVSSTTPGPASEPNICRIKLNQEDSARSVILDPLPEFSDLEENWFRCTALGPLGLRGWCLQEKLLSRRILFYGKRQIYWQCASARKAADGESVPASAARSQANIGNDVSDWPDVLRLRQLHREAATPEQRQAIETKIYKTWHNVLFLYINRRLTFYSDRLPGLAGMATLIHELTGDQYVAGFWHKYLLTSLIWTHTKSVLREEAPRSIAERYETETPEWEKETSKMSGPSWSWCSHDFTDILDFWADFNEDYRQSFWKRQDAEVMAVNVDIVGGNPFGQVKSGELVLRGWTYPRWDVRTLDEGALQKKWQIWSSVNLGVCPHSPWNRNRGSDGLCEDRAVLWDYWPRQTKSPAKRAWIHLFRWLIDIFVLFLWQGLSKSFRERSQKDCHACNEYICMHILSIVNKEPGRDGRHGIDLWSLVLELVPGKEGKYRRVGIARKAAYASKGEFLDSKSPTAASAQTPKAFDGWKSQKVTII
ncbi:HET-domain-containing protein [Acephala macrosclerotiorum]|nr:HET-domain-containing protein [Acephala macrosclerotiorum]